MGDRGKVYKKRSYSPIKWPIIATGKIIVKMYSAFDREKKSDADIKVRYTRFYGKDDPVSKAHLPHYRNKGSNLSEFLKEIKQPVTRDYHKRHHRRGTLRGGERFKSCIVENGETLINFHGLVISIRFAPASFPAPRSPGGTRSDTVFCRIIKMGFFLLISAISASLNSVCRMKQSGYGAIAGMYMKQALWRNRGTAPLA
jgi:hypothetical protein